jgi:peptide/nickel transport system ATP-binding protein/oligopeptide transport system ATP-binding protein
MGVTSADAPLLEVRSLAKHYVDRAGARLRAVDGVSFTLRRGEVLGIVGESGCGKSTLGRAVMRLVEPDAGEVRLDGRDFARLSGRALREARRRMQMVFQDPFGSLNPRHRAGAIIAEPMKVHGLPDAKARVAELLRLVGLSPDAVERYPHEFSGGQRQRIAIARALALSPDIVIADEPVSALDVSVQSQIINLIVELRAKLGLSMIFVSHDLSVVRHVADRVAVMYFGRIVELAPTPELFAAPRHPYTQALLAAVPRPVQEAVKLAGRHAPPRPGFEGEMPDPADPPRGCAFRARCPIAVEKCTEAPPRLARLSADREVACYRAEAG